MTHIFISYSHNDRDFVDILIGKLREADITAWLDAEQLRAGEDWRQAIDDGIRASFALIAIMSPEAKKSEYVTYEWAYAWGAGIKVIPIVLHQTELHPRLEALQHLNFTEPQQRPWDQMFKRLSDLRESYIPPRSKTALSSGIEQLRNDLQDPDSNQRRNAAKALGNIQDKSVVPDLIYTMSNDDNWAVRRDAVGALGSIGDIETTPWLIRALHNDQSYRVREAVAWALGEITLNEDTTKNHLYVKGIISSLKEAAYDDRHRLIQQVCINTLGRIGQNSFYASQAVQALIGLLNGYFLDKFIVIHALAQSDVPEALAAVEEWRRKQQNQQ